MQCQHLRALHPCWLAKASQLFLENLPGLAGRAFTPLNAIPKELQLSTGAKGQLTLETRGSRFVKYQELKLQELASEVC